MLVTGAAQAAPIGQEQKAYQVTGLAGESLLCQSKEGNRMGNRMTNLERMCLAACLIVNATLERNGFGSKAYDRAYELWNRLRDRRNVETGFCPES